MFTNTECSQVPLLDKSTPVVEDIVVTMEGVTKLLKGLIPPKAKLCPDKLHHRALKELATESDPVFAHLYQQSIENCEFPKE